ncbi:unnamed protein product [Rotaria magnacalcarata]|uniref:Transposase n=2 Tax=Rotaria magnacalcarata TaxID=392030 RepID=A0A815GN78_9BILA|nr:unnamed protein product [Rotaria magnacalcarata]CAF3963884.1 unnamed protein product [Rotaria magnacalcarata]CAF4030544.1 unnamed protein product [Rotaria magnacalcarata]CAF4032434.1 unnamed protein product [Rotaria magnacalcarata]CAF4140701.1 unnamed protein product [Rotaria magnacalcarata]
MNSNTQSTINFIPQRDLRSNTSSTITIQTPMCNANKNLHHVNVSSKSTTTSSILNRKFSKPILRRSNSAKTPSNSSKAKKKSTLSRNNDTNQPNEPSDSMDQDTTERTTVSFDEVEIISDPIVNNHPANQNETDQLLNCSIETVDETHEVKRTTTATKSDVLNYFTRLSDGSFKCILCQNSNKVFSKRNETSDTNLRSDLDPLSGASTWVSIEEKKKLDETAIEAIVQDGLPFNHFQKSGMKNFLPVIKYGYQDPHRRTVRKRLGILYQQRRAFIKKKLSSVLHISLRTDVWKSPNNEFFICLTCHFLISSYANESFILKFRRFDDKHTGQKFRSFINNELQKMNSRLKMSSITTDGDSDIKSATLGAAFGRRLSCVAHNLN